MRAAWARLARAWGLGLFVAGVFFSGAQAQTPERVRELVFYVNTAQAAGWHGALYPASEDTIYLLADRVSTLSARATMVYYWPITQRYIADWAMLDEQVTGRLEIRSFGRVVDVLDMTDYVLQDPAGGGEGGASQLFTGAAAREQFAVYQAQLDAYWESLREAAEATAAGETRPEPVYPTLFSTTVLQGFAVNLPVGAYQIRLLDAAGQTLPESEKSLVVFAPRRYGVGYQIVPEARWTTPESSATPQETIYVAGAARLFLQPNQQAEFNAFQYGKLLDPQAPPGDKAGWRWEPVAPLPGAVLRLAQGGAVTEAANEGFVVNQIGGGNLGYEIEPFVPGGDRAAPSFTGHEVSLQLPPGASATLGLLDEQGQPIAGSERTVRGLAAPAGWRIFLPAALPLAAVVWLAVRRARLQK